MKLASSSRGSNPFLLAGAGRARFARRAPPPFCLSPPLWFRHRLLRPRFGLPPLPFAVRPLPLNAKLLFLRVGRRTAVGEWGGARTAAVDRSSIGRIDISGHVVFALILLAS